MPATSETRAKYTHSVRLSDGDVMWKHFHYEHDALQSHQGVIGRADVLTSHVTLQDFGGPDCSMRRIVEWKA